MRVTPTGHQHPPVASTRNIKKTEGKGAAALKENVFRWDWPTEARKAQGKGQKKIFFD